MGRSSVIKELLKRGLAGARPGRWPDCGSILLCKARRVSHPSRVRYPSAVAASDSLASAESDKPLARACSRTYRRREITLGRINPDHEAVDQTVDQSSRPCFAWPLAWWNVTGHRNRCLEDIQGIKSVSELVTGHGGTFEVFQVIKHQQPNCAIACPELGPATLVTGLGRFQASFREPCRIEVSDG